MVLSYNSSRLNSWTIINLTNKKDCRKILTERKKLKKIDHNRLSLPRGTKAFINESLSSKSSSKNDYSHELLRSNVF